MKKIFLIVCLIIGINGLAQQEHSGGIETATGFKLSDPQPIDDRYVVADSASLNSLPNKYEGLVSYAKAEDALFTYNGSTWNRVGNDSGGGGITPTLQQVLDEGSTADIDDKNFTLNSDNVKIAHDDSGTSFLEIDRNGGVIVESGGRINVTSGGKVELSAAEIEMTTASEIEMAGGAKIKLSNFNPRPFEISVAGAEIKMDSGAVIDLMSGRDDVINIELGKSNLKVNEDGFRVNHQDFNYIFPNTSGTENQVLSKTGGDEIEWKTLDISDLTDTTDLLFSGEYDDLDNKPTIPAQVNLIAGDNVDISGTYPNLTINSRGGSNLTLEQARQNGNVFEGDVVMDEGFKFTTPLVTDRQGEILSEDGIFLWIQKEAGFFSSLMQYFDSVSISSDNPAFRGIIGNDEFDKQGDRKAFAQIADVEDALEDYIKEPTTDGTSGQVLTTDGLGGRSWTTVSGGGGGDTNIIESISRNGTPITPDGNKNVNIPIFSSSGAGLVPARVSSEETTKFLREDGIWAIPAAPTTPNLTQVLTVGNTTTLDLITTGGISARRVNTPNISMEDGSIEDEYGILSIEHDYSIDLEAPVLKLKGMEFPSTAGTSGQVLTTDGTNMNWTTPVKNRVVLAIDESNGVTLPAMTGTTQEPFAPIDLFDVCPSVDLDYIDWEITWKVRDTMFKATALGDYNLQLTWSSEDCFQITGETMSTVQYVIDDVETEAILILYY